MIGKAQLQAQIGDQHVLRLCKELLFGSNIQIAYEA